MSEPNRDGVRVAVVGSAPAAREPVRAALADAAVTVTDDGTVDDVSDPDATQVECVVCTSAAAYDRVRERWANAPVVVVADLDREAVERVVADGHAAHLHPDGDLGAALPVHVREVCERSGTTAAWQLADFADRVIVEFDPDTLALREANAAFFDRWGWERGALADATVADLRVTDITHELRGQGRGADGEEDLEWIDGDNPVASMIARARGGNHETREWHCVADDGTAFKADVDVVVDEHGTAGFLVADVPDPDDRKSDERGHDYDEGAMLRSLVEHVPMSVYFKDAESRHVLVSEDVVEPFIESPEGKIMHTPEDVHGKTDFDLYEAAHAAEAVDDDRSVIERGEPIRDRVEHAQPPNGMDLFYRTTKAPWYDSDGLARGTIGVTVDVTEQKHRERELDRQNERLEEFAGMLSHDLRNPLNVAHGNLRVYEERGDEDALTKVYEMHERMEQLIEEVLAYAREGSHIDEMEWFDVGPVAAEAWGSVDTGDATLEGDWDYGVRADPDRLTRLFENLFRNAVEHAGPDVAVRAGTLTDAPGFYVEDDGPGIPEAERDEVFDRGVSSDEDGTGFGLAIVREIADAHGWDVTASESDDGGARFEVTGVTRGE